MISGAIDYNRSAGIRSILDFVRCNPDEGTSVFVRLIGEDRDYVGSVSSAERLISSDYRRVKALPLITDPVDSQYYSQAYADWKRSGGRNEISIHISRNNPGLGSKIGMACFELLRVFRLVNPGFNDSVEKNFVVKTLYRLDALLDGFDLRSAPKLCGQNVTKVHDYLFYYAAAIIGVNVLLLQNSEDIPENLKRTETSKSAVIGHLGSSKLPDFSGGRGGAPVSRAQSPVGSSRPQYGAPSQSTYGQSRPSFSAPAQNQYGQSRPSGGSYGSNSGRAQSADSYTAHTPYDGSNTSQPSYGGSNTARPYGAESPRSESSHRIVVQGTPEYNIPGRSANARSPQEHLSTYRSIRETSPAPQTPPVTPRSSGSSSVRLAPPPDRRGNVKLVIPPRPGRSSSRSGTTNAAPPAPVYSPPPVQPSAPAPASKKASPSFGTVMYPQGLSRSGPDTARVSSAIPSARRRELSYEELAQLSPSVVQILVMRSAQDVSPNGDCRACASGSGVMIGYDGYIITNCHVATSGRVYGVRVENDDRVYFTDQLIKYHNDYDLAVIKIDRKLSPLPLFNGPEKLVRGQRVAAIGSPLGMFNTVSDGIISGFRDVDGVEMIQFTAPISSGSSGGAVLNMYGELIGISTGGLSSKTGIAQNINLAVSCDTIRMFCGNILA